MMTLRRRARANAACFLASLCRAFLLLSLIYSPHAQPLSELQTAIDGDRQSRADLSHAPVAQPAQTLGQRSDRNTLNRVEIHSRLTRDRTLIGFQ
jgi:hypothetical protein